MTDYTKLVKALRCKRGDCEGCDLAFFDNDEGWICQYAAKDDDAADAIEALQEQVRMLDKHDTDLHNEGYDVGYYAGRRDWEPKPGKWIHGKELSRAYVGNCCVGIVYEDFRCSACGVIIEECEKPKWKYCPNCGAKMGVQDGKRCD